MPVEDTDPDLDYSKRYFNIWKNLVMHPDPFGPGTAPKFPSHQSDALFTLSITILYRS